MIVMTDVHQDNNPVFIIDSIEDSIMSCMDSSRPFKNIFHGFAGFRIFLDEEDLILDLAAEFFIVPAYLPEF